MNVTGVLSASDTGSYHKLLSVSKTGVVLGGGVHVYRVAFDPKANGQRLGGRFRLDEAHPDG